MATKNMVYYMRKKQRMSTKKETKRTFMEAKKIWNGNIDDDHQKRWGCQQENQNRDKDCRHIIKATKTNITANITIIISDVHNMYVDHNYTIYTNILLQDNF